MEDEEKKVSWFEKHPKATFWWRLALWLLFAAILPFIFIVWRFKLFEAISSVQLGGWGIIGIAIIAIVLLSMFKYIRMALSAKYTLVGQCVSGVCKIVIPIAALLLILQGVKGNIDSFIKTMGIVLICETVAIPINPLPKWAYECQKGAREDERKETFDYLVDKFFTRKKKEEEE